MGFNLDPFGSAQEMSAQEQIGPTATVETYQRQYNVRGNAEVQGCERIELRKRTRDGWKTVKTFTGGAAYRLSEWVDEAEMEGISTRHIDAYLNEVAHGARP